MNLKKISGILLLVIITLTIIGAVSAATITVSGENFNIPDGYKEDASLANTTDNGWGITEKKVLVSDDNNITINVFTMNGGSNADFEISPDENDTPKTVNGVDGYYNSEDGCFTYKSNGKLVTIFAEEADLDKIIP